MKYIICVGVIVLVLVVVGFVVDAMLASKGALNQDQVEQSEQFNGTAFENTIPISLVSLGDSWPLIKAYMFEKEQPAAPASPINVIPITPEQLQSLDPKETVFFRLGHSSILLWLDGNFWLIDPVFSLRASPFSFAGPKRFHEPPISIDDLPAIKGVMISHNHYDHLDKSAIEQLKDKVEYFLVPLGIGGDLKQWGVADTKIHELDWWQNRTIGSVTLTATPAKHFSGRGISDSNITLWSGWAIQGLQHSVFFSGDSGYFNGFKTIGERLGPFDISFVETGAYNRLWPDVHMMPEQSVQAHIDVNAQVMVPIHNGTFDLALHKWTDPFEQVAKIAQQRNFRWISPQMGEQVTLGQEPDITPWWQQLVTAIMQ